MDKKDNGNLYKKTAYLYDLDPRPLVKDDIPFYLKYAAKMKGSILELASGSGRVTIPLAKAGYDVWGVDLSDIMMTLIKDKMTALTEDVTKRIRLLHEDMCTFKINRKFPLIIIPIRSFGVLLDERQQNQCLKNVYNHLSDDGLFIITLLKPIDNIETNWIKREEDFDWENIDPKTGLKVCRNSRRKNIDPHNQIIYIDVIYSLEKGDGSEEKRVEEISFKYLNCEQIRELLTANGFKIFEEMGYYDGRPISEGPELIYLCQKK